MSGSAHLANHRRLLGRATRTSVDISATPDRLSITVP